MDPAVESIEKNLKRFGVADYVVFVAMLVMCGFIGVYFGFIRKTVSTSEYLVGGRKMKVIPIALSLVASWISGISLLGTPTEIYLYGVQYMYIIFGLILMALCMSYAYLPVFHNLKLTSTYEYLEKRFDSKVRLLGSLLFTVSNLTWLPIVVYVPALAFNQVTGINLHLVTPAVSIVCIFYTCVGGLKAVVWTDVVQSLIMYGAMFLIVIKGTLDVGGFSVVWQRNYDSDRIEGPNFEFDMTARYNIWSLTFGGFFQWLISNAVGQTMMQRYLCLPTLKKAQTALVLYLIGVTFLLALCSYSGMVVFATYYDCDPVATKVAKAHDQLLPLLATDILGEYPGIPGLFVAGVFSAALSSMSTGLNSMAAVVREDFIKRPLTEKQSDIIMKTVVVVTGAICVGLVFLVETLGTVIQVSASLSAISHGPSLGIFTAGLFFPWMRPPAILFGGLAGLTFMSLFSIGAQRALASGATKAQAKPLSVEGCTYNITHSVQNITHTLESDGSGIFKISWMWYTMLGFLVTIIVALVISAFTEKNPPGSIDKALLSPLIHPLVEKKKLPKKTLLNGYTGTNIELHSMKENEMLKD